MSRLFDKSKLGLEEVEGNVDVDHKYAHFGIMCHNRILDDFDTDIPVISKIGLQKFFENLRALKM